MRKNCYEENFAHFAQWQSNTAKILSSKLTNQSKWCVQNDNSNGCKNNASNSLD